MICSDVLWLKADRIEVLVSTDSTILCIDDEALGLQIRKAVLERAGYRVLTALDGQSGISLFRSHPIDAVVLDFYMPEMDGGKVAAIMRDERPQIPILLLSAYINLPSETTSLADLTLLKGGEPSEFLARIGQMLEASRVKTRKGAVGESA
jgi:CheY-like chemotaxis protein